jgi:NAD(P)-dependent dehydrogenase (short-subunit alcohol dehydrogenase family)
MHRPRKDGLALSKGPLPYRFTLAFPTHDPLVSWNNLSLSRLLTFLSLYVWVPDDQNDARLVVVSSSAHYEAKGVPLSLQGVNAQRDVGGFNAYAESKLANLLFAQQVRNRHKQQSVHHLHSSWPFLVQLPCPKF